LSEFPNTPNTIGIHARRTDVDLNHINPHHTQLKTLLPKLAKARDNHYLTQLQKILPPNTPLYIATDDQNTKNTYTKHYPNATTTTNTKLPTLITNIHPNPTKYGRWNQTLRTQTTNEHALIELLILARCHTIITDYDSTYALTAHYLTGANLLKIKPTHPIIIKHHKPK
jgi:hypothetical protein